MNYYNPYFYAMPQMASTATRTGLFSRLFGGLSLGRIVSGTERALNFANQAIPLVKQVKPIIGNAKTMFKVMNEFKRQETRTMNSDTKVNNNYNQAQQQNNYKPINSNEPTFFM